MERKLQVLSGIAQALNASGAEWALGASALLYLHGLVTEFHDIDITAAESSIETVTHVMNGLGELQQKNPNAQYKTTHFLEYAVDGVDVDVMSGFVIVKDGVDYPQSFDTSHVEQIISVNGVPVPLQRLVDWQQYYALMGRMAKAELISEYLKQ